MPNIGTNLGTSNSAAAVMRGGRPIVIPSAEGTTLGGKPNCPFCAAAIQRTDMSKWVISVISGALADVCSYPESDSESRHGR